MGSKLTQLKYSEKLTESFITAKRSEMSTKQGGRPSCSNLLQLIPQHFPNVIPPNEITLPKLTLPEYVILFKK